MTSLLMDTEVGSFPAIAFTVVVLPLPGFPSMKTAVGGPLNFAWGLEQRWESYQIEAGQPESYNRGPLGANAALTGGAQGFVGFQLDLLDLASRLI